MNDRITLSNYLKSRFGGKVAKISIDGGFSCPNRSNGGTGCLFCTDEGAGEFCGDSSKSITNQINDGKIIMDKKWTNIGYIAYFQNFSNTYGSIAKLKNIYDEALNCKDIIGIAIATRPDCFSEEIYELLKSYNEKTLLWIELGFQTSNENTSRLINRGYSNSVFVNTIKKLKSYNIKTVVHLIGGLPGESKKNFLESSKFVSDLMPWGIKLHSIYVQENSPLYEFSIKTGFEPLDMETYIDWVTDAILVLDKKIVIHRVTGDPDKRKLIKPNWQKNKLRVLSEINRVLLEKESSN